jgi:predicted CDP-diglyceride synthetase/phosphatidate cytidylyltransferase
MVNKINPKVLAISFLLITLFWDIVGYIWHGLLRQPSVIDIVYPSFWSSPTLLLYGLIGTLISAYICGYIFALIYNWSSIKFEHKR